jgi:hypothetical protein
MARASEKCSCGATIEVSSDYDTRVRAALEEWRKGHQHTPPAAKADPETTPEHHPQGNNFAATERKGNSLEPYEMHAGWRPDSYGSISLKWHPKEES